MVVTSNQVDIEIDKEEVGHYMGYDGDYKLSARISSVIDNSIDDAHRLIEPSYSYVIRDVEHVQGSTFAVQGPITFKSKNIARLLEHCHKVAVFLVTIGRHIEEETHRLAQDGRILHAAAMDAIGSAAVEEVIGFVQSRIEDIAGTQELVSSLRFSPGYCDWDITQQEAIFQIVSGAAVGVQLTERYLMIPQKSVSGIIGLGPADRNVENYNPCDTCRKYACPNRRTG
ncbi:MAG: hypothetical protein JW732_00715 [Dehalococcoidia bacterium]|nr:hypothetical protein [Dehalococcoidia bacterium]